MLSDHSSLAYSALAIRGSIALQPRIDFTAALQLRQRHDGHASNTARHSIVLARFAQRCCLHDPLLHLGVYAVAPLQPLARSPLVTSTGTSSRSCFAAHPDHLQNRGGLQHTLSHISFQCRPVKLVVDPITRSPP